MKRWAGRLVVVGIAFATVACAPGQAAFEEEAEKTIDGDDGKALTVDVSSADCESPTSTATNTTFACEAVDGTGTVWNFVATITSENKFVVTLG